MYKIQAGGIVYNEVKNPYVVFDKSIGTLMKIGEKEAMEEYFTEVHEKYQLSGFQTFSEDLVLLELPKVQDEIDRVFDTTGYIKVLYKRMLENQG